MTQRSRASESGASERSSATGGGGSVNMLMNSSIYIAKVPRPVVTIVSVVLIALQELGFALDDDGFAAKSLIDARLHRLRAAIAAEVARNSKSQNVMSLEREKNLCIKGASAVAAVFLCCSLCARHD
jgi:hypothetical protein